MSLGGVSSSIYIFHTNVDGILSGTFVCLPELLVAGDAAPQAIGSLGASFLD